jgi:SIR2-like domain
MEPPYAVILDRLRQGKVIPFFGAGASVTGRGPNDTWVEASPFLPSGAELSQLLARQVQFSAVSNHPEEAADLLKVSAYFEESSGRDVLREELHSVLARDCAPGPLHRLAASIEGLRLLVTTNYDTLIERAFDAVKRPYDLVIYPKDSDDTAASIMHWPAGAAAPLTLSPDDLQIDLEKTTVIFKMHGSIDDRSGTPTYDNFVITEDDYIEFLARMTSGTAVPKNFLRHFRGRSFLFLGYSLSDWNMRIVLRNLGREFEAQSQRSATTKHWAIQRSPSELEKWLWRKRGVNVYEQDLQDFVDRLTAHAPA